MENNKTNSDNLEARYDAGEDVLDYFDTGKAIRRNQLEQVMPAKPLPVRNRLKRFKIKAVEATPNGPEQSLQLRRLPGGRELGVRLANSH